MIVLTHSIKPGGTTLAEPSLKLTSRSPEETQQLGRIIGVLARPGDIILLSGPLGAGKHLASWNGRDDKGVSVSSGIYMVLFSLGAKRTEQKLVVIR